MNFGHNVGGFGNISFGYWSLSGHITFEPAKVKKIPKSDPKNYTNVIIKSGPILFLNWSLWNKNDPNVIAKLKWAQDISQDHKDTTNSTGKYDVD